MSTLDSKYKAVRSVTRSLAASLSAEDQMVQSCTEASPVKWNQAHTTWFFETFVLRPFLVDYKPFREEFRWLFNSYYNSPVRRFRKRGCAHPSRVPHSIRSSHSVRILTKRWSDFLRARLVTTSRDASFWDYITSNSTRSWRLADIKHAFFSNPLCPANQDSEPEPNECAQLRSP